MLSAPHNLYEYHIPCNHRGLPGGFIVIILYVMFVYHYEHEALLWQHNTEQWHSVVSCNMKFHEKDIFQGETGVKLSIIPL